MLPRSCRLCRGSSRAQGWVSTHPEALGFTAWWLPGGSPEVALVGSVLDVIADVIEHPVGRGAVPGIEHLEQGSSCGDVPAPRAEPGRGNTAHGELQAPL